MFSLDEERKQDIPFTGQHVFGGLFETGPHCIFCGMWRSADNLPERCSGPRGLNSELLKIRGSKEMKDDIIGPGLYPPAQPIKLPAVAHKLARPTVITQFFWLESLETGELTIGRLRSNRQNAGWSLFNRTLELTPDDIVKEYKVLREAMKPEKR